MTITFHHIYPFSDWMRFILNDKLGETFPKGCWKKLGKQIREKFPLLVKYGHFLLSCTHVMVEKVLILGQIFEMEILMDLHVLRSPVYENHVFSVCCRLRKKYCTESMYVCECGVCYQHNSRTNCCRDFKFGILHLYHMQMQLETFNED